MKKPIKIKNFNYSDQSSAVEFMEEHEMTAYSEINPFLKKTTTTEKKVETVHSEEARKEYWPFLESV